jgi:phosphoglycolate phosphatase
VKARLEGLFFDLDGTLADTAPDLGGALNDLRGELGLPPVALTALRPFTSQGVRGMLRAGLGMATDHHDYAATSMRFLDIYESRLCRETTLFDGIDAVLGESAELAVACGVVTNKSQRFTPRLMRLLDLERRLACAVSGDSAPRAKPSARPILLAAQLAGVAPERCAYVGDDERDIVAGRAAGMMTIAVRWGYHGDCAPIESWGADRILDAPSELLGLLRH